ncbi:quinone-dependent dihydroorotate dehydrogenase [Anaplasma bovis]|uniref:quinone-dependent dihydroorotate dehydrogenase n=1 Tax=Anaplasma bovis TaxID=186733 RepID=UPI002FF0B286
MLLHRLLNPTFLVPPELAHRLAIFSLKQGLYQSTSKKLPDCLGTTPLNFRVRTPIGLAAGFDKNAEVIGPIMSLGFGFVEVGTVTRIPQYGNRKPRLFRIIDKNAVINCLGFNNKGIKYLLKKVDVKDLNNLAFGINVGLNKGCKNPAEEFAELVKTVYGVSKYITINISSPNTEGLRSLQRNRENLNAILESVKHARRSADHAESVPILLKIDPDISDETKQDIVDAVIGHKINGIIVGNTSTNFSLLGKRELPCKHGGVSGEPLFDLSTRVLSEIYSLVGDRVVLVGCGGVSTGAQALQKIKSGASLVQLYTAMVYKGFGIVNKINLELAELLTREGFSKVEQAVGIDV